MNTGPGKQKKTFTIHGGILGQVFQYFFTVFRHCNWFQKSSGFLLKTLPEFAEPSNGLRPH